MMDAVLENNIELAIQQYQAFRADPTNTYVNTEQDLRLLGYHLILRKRYDEAIRILKLAVDKFPHSHWVYEDLGAAYIKLGNKDLAIKNYEKSLELNPVNWDVIDALKTLRGK